MSKQTIGLLNLSVLLATIISILHLARLHFKPARRRAVNEAREVAGDD